MMKNIFSKITKCLGLAALGSLLPLAAQAASIDFPASFAGLSSQDIKTTLGNIVQIVLGFLGILTVLFFLYGGFLWMTSFGNADKIDQAKKIMVSATIGLVVVLTAYAVSSFVVGSLANAV